ncbi:MAG: NADP-dependent isocitrate dehydrogenase [Opitutales bacterium]
MTKEPTKPSADLSEQSTGGTPVITVMQGDGIGPEVAGAAIRIIEATGLKIDWEYAEAGKKVFERGVASGVPAETVDSISRTKVALKGPLETPVGFGGKSANVTLRKLFETFGNIRPVRELPGIQTPFSGLGIDLVVVRENVEDLYAGIEHMQTHDVAQCLKLISRKGCEKISRLAFELAKAEGRDCVHVATKANIMKQTEGMMKRVFEEVAEDYAGIESKHLLIDNCAHQLLINPCQFEVITTTNMNGDILSDLTSGLVGGLGLAPSANIGHEAAMFEAVHGSAPDIAGKDRANPTAMILSSVMLLRHIGEFEAASQIENALMCTLESGEGYPGDIARGRRVVGTRAFTDAVIARLGQAPEQVKLRAHAPMQVPAPAPSVTLSRAAQREVVGADVFIEFDGPADQIGRMLEDAATGTAFKLKMISNRGTMVYPGRGAQTDCVDHWRCRFTLRQSAPDIATAAMDELLRRIEAKELRWMHIEKLQCFDGEAAYTKAQGED